MDAATAQERRDEERRLRELLDESERLKLSRLRFDDLRALGHLYRVHAARLAQLRERGDDPDAIRHLNGLCVRAYTLLYGGGSRRFAPTASGGRLSDALARSWRAFAFAAALLGVGCVIGGALAERDPQALLALGPTRLGYSPIALEELAESADARRRFFERSEMSLGEYSIFGSSLFAHNTQVGLLSLAAGILLGIPTVILQIYNGLILGALSSVFLGTETAVDYLAWILPHGVPELTAISLCAAGGLLLGAAVVAPGRRRRGHALREGIDSALLLFGLAVPLFLAAALIESFVRESTLGNAPRLALAAALAMALVVGMWLLRRLSRRREVATSWLGELTDPVRSGSRDSG